MAMDFFRRPALVGKGPLGRLTSGRVRGSVRRSDPDGTSAVPYFPLVSIGQILTFVTQGGAGTATLTGVSLTQVIADIQTALGANAKAEIDDGCLAIESAVTGAAGFVRITGGNASSGLGDETYGGTRVIESRGADIASAPEGRVGNPFGTAFMEKIENLTTESVSRGMGRMAANADVLWSDHVKSDFQTKTVAFAASGDGTYITPTSTQRVFTGLPTMGGLTRTSLKTDLIGYYQLVDPATGLAAPSQVVAVVRGVPVGDPAYADSPSWTDSTGKNVLGLDMVKVNAATISSITEGRYLKCSGVTFVTTGVLPGDYLEVASATNLTPFSNNGYRWIVEQVLSEDTVAVRPMSKSELVSIGTSVTDTQPLVELNDTKSGLEVFGTCTIRTGPSQQNVNLAVRPPIPANTAYQLRVAIPSSVRDNTGYEGQFSMQAAFKELGSQYAPVHDGMLSGCNVSTSGGNVVVAAGTARWNGRVISIPATTILNASFQDGATNYVWFDETAAAIKHSIVGFDFNQVDDPSGSPGRGHLLATVLRSGGIIVQVKNCKRTIADWNRSATVGQGAQFQSIDSALTYFNTFSRTMGETGTAVGNYNHVELILTNNSQYSGTNILIPNLTIRGANPSIQLDMTSPLLLQLEGSLVVKDLQINPLFAPVNAFIKSTIGTSKIHLQNIRQLDTTQFDYAILVNAPGNIDRVRIEDCRFVLTTGLVRGDGSGVNSSVYINNSRFSSTNVTATPIWISDDSAATSSLDDVVVTNCVFDADDGAWGTTSATDAMFINTAGVGSRLLLENIKLSIGTHDSSSNSLLIGVGGFGYIRGLDFDNGYIPRVVAGNAKTSVEGCSLFVDPEGSGSSIVAQYVNNNTLTHQDTLANTAGGFGITAASAGAVISYNTLTGPFSTAINAQSIDDCQVIGNKITLTFIAFAHPFRAINIGSTTRAVAAENELTFNSGSFSGLMIDASSTSEVNVSGNRVHMKNPIVASIGHVFIQLVTASNPKCSGNSLKTTGTAVAGASQSVVGIRLNGSNAATVDGNNTVLAGNSTVVWWGIEFAGNQYSNITGNYVEVYGQPIEVSTNADPTNIISSNHFHGVGAIPFTGRLFGVVTNNIFSFGGAAADHTATIGCGIFTGNHFNKVNYARGSEAISDTIFSNNTVDSTLAISTSDALKIEMANNRFASTVSLTLGAGSVVHSNGNRCSGAFDITATGGSGVFSCSGCRFSSSMTITDCDDLWFCNNRVNSTFDWNLTVNFDGVGFIDNNHISGTFTIDDIDAPLTAAIFRVNRLYITNNDFSNGNPTAWTAYAQILNVINNFINPTLGGGPITVTIAGEEVRFEDNRVEVAEGLPTGTNIVTCPVVIGSFTNRWWFNRNKIDGKVDLSNYSVDFLEFNENFAFANLQDDTVTTPVITTSGHVSKNSLTASGSGLASWNWGALQVQGSTPANITISDNLLEITSNGSSYPGITTTYPLHISSTIAASGKTTITGNIIKKIANATISGFLITSSYIRIVNNQFVSMANNIMFSANVIGPAGIWQGDHYISATGTTTIDATTTTP